MRNLTLIIGAGLLLSTAGCAYRPYGYRYYDYGFWRDRRSDGHG